MEIPKFAKGRYKQEKEFSSLYSKVLGYARVAILNSSYWFPRKNKERQPYVWQRKKKFRGRGYDTLTRADGSE
jgi:hypothetical protein